MSISAYLHIPFCTHKCEFCDFAAFAGLDHLETQYCEVMQDEIRERSKNLTERTLQSVFYGGGTPGLISVENLAGVHDALISRFPLENGAEVSLETTPHSITLEKAKAWLALGINRLSIGVESLQDSELKAIGRDHDVAQALLGISTATEAGFKNISVDLMYGLPTQTVESWTESLKILMELTRKNKNIRHFSSYGLHLANNSPLYSRFPKNSDAFPDDELFEGMYKQLVAHAEGNGFEQYEISNFCKPGFASQHNLAYWNNSEYLGFGVSAHRYVGGVRSSNWRSLKLYMKDYLGDETHEVIDAETQMKEALMLGLRLRAGIDLGTFALEYGFDISEKYRKELLHLKEGGFVEVSEAGDNRRLRITQKGVPVSNSIISALF